jgi:transcriptional regulator with AAA-type ATPase domain/tetratricopeptide (TPR) repeat protein
MDALGELIGDSPSIVALRKQVLGLLQRQQGTRRLPPILIQGETGTGKGLLARVVHARGPRAGGPFIEVNCAAIPETMLEAEMFGYERGAFTDARQSKAGLFQAADSGTLFLDEVGLLPQGLQAKLLTAIEQGSIRRLGSTRNEPVSVSIIAATNANLAAAVRDGRFREDLYHRLAVLPIHLPPLRERGDDVELLAERLLARVCADYGLPAKILAPDARAALHAHSWPGNVRELSNALERAALLSDAVTLTAEVLDLPSDLPLPTPPTLSSPGPEREHSARDRLAEALETTGWNITRTAAMLDITRNTVRARIERYRLRPGGGEGEASAPESEPRSPGEAAVEPLGISAVRWQPRRVAFLRAIVVQHGDGASPFSTHALDRAVDKIHSFGGRVEEIGQRGIVAAFGHDPAEDAPRRAAYAAIAITKAVERDRRSQETSRHVSVAIAIHIARVPVARVGTTVEIDQDAKRDVWLAFEGMAPGTAGAITVSDAALPFLARRFEIRRSAAPEPPGNRLLGREPFVATEEAAFIGRRHEQELLQGLLDRVTDGWGQVVTVVGEPGIGKSRLLHEFRQSLATTAVSVLEGRCASYGVNVPYFPVLEMLQAVYGIEEADSPDAVDTKVSAALEQFGPVGVAWMPYVQHLIYPRREGKLAKLSPEAIKNRTFDALQQMVIRRQEQGPLVLIVEDLHWIDKTSEELLASLADIMVKTRVLLLTTCRPGYQPPWTGRSHATHMALGPLSTDQSRRLIESILQGESPDDALVAAILTRADGNPFFLEELARAVRQQDRRSDLRVPDTVHDVLVARIEALSDGDRSVLQVAAVLGRDVSGALLQDTCELPPEHLDTSLARLQTGEFLYATGFGSSSSYRFKHALTHEVAYGTVFDADRPRLHARAAAAIEKLSPETQERRPEVLARHHEEAGRPAEAVKYWYRAGQLAMGRSAHVEATAHLTRAAELIERLPHTPDRDHQDVLVHLALGTSLAATRGYAAPEVELPIARARALVEGLGDSPQLLRVRWSLWRFYLPRADFRTAEELAARLLGAAERQDDPIAHVGARLAAGVNKFYLGEFEAAREHFEQALRIYDPRQSQALALAYGQDLGIAARGFLAWVGAVTGDLAAAAQHVTRALDLARVLDHPFSLAAALFLAAEVHQLRRDAPMVESLGQELLSLSQDHSFTFFTALGLMFSGCGRATTTGTHDALVMMKQAADLLQAAGQRVGLAHRARLAEVMLAQGFLDESLSVVADALRQAEETGEHAFLSEHHRLRGEVLARQAQPDDATACFRTALALSSRQGAWLFALRAVSSLVRLGVERGSPAAADLDALSAIVSRFSPALELPDLALARTLLLEGRR